MDEEIREALRNAANHIERLQAENRELAIMARSYDAMCNLIGALTPKRGEYSMPDPVYILRKLLTKMEAAKAASGNTQNEG
jgi:hypothetical protein